MKYALLCSSVLLAILAAPGLASADVEGSLRASGWSGSRTAADDKGPIIEFEAWGRGEWRLAENLDAHAEGWVAIDPVGEGSADGDIRDAYASWRIGEIQIDGGRKVFAWGRADRLNPTDVLGARDYRRLVEDEGDTRLGIGSVTGRFELAGGEFSVVWAPEFRATELPQTFEQPGLHVAHSAPDAPERQFAVRYERFGQAIDWSVTYADVYDATPWLSLHASPGAVPTLTLFHPHIGMLGADMATTVGGFGVRAEAAVYDYDILELHGAATYVPTFAAALGIDRDILRHTNLNLQVVVHGSDAATPPAGQAAVASRNDAIHYAWNDIIAGGLARVRSSFSQDRGSLEFSAAGFDGGGQYQQIRLGYALLDGVRLSVTGERFGGSPSSLFGSLEDNTLITVGVRLGY